MDHMAMVVGVTFCLGLVLGCGGEAAPGAAAGDKLDLWQRGALRGANVLPPGNTQEDMAVLRSWGANLAEIAVMDIYDPRRPYEFRPEALAELDAAVEAAERAGLYIALTCRTGPGRADFNRSQEVWADAEAQKAYARMWKHLAAHYRGREAVVGYDLMCEPHPEQQHAGVWNSLARQITRAIREVDPDTPVLVNSIGWAYPQTFEVLEPTGDPRTVYVVHFYDPHYYTHQRPQHQRPYPGFTLPDEDGKPWTKETIRERLLPVRRFQGQHRVPIFAGEFGCARYAPGAEQWLRDQMDLYEEWHWSWAYWAFREWDVMDIEKSPDPADKERHADTPLLRLFKSYFARDTDFPRQP